MPTIEPNIQFVQMAEGIGSGPVISNHPTPELLDGLNVEVERLGADAAFNGLVFLFLVEAEVVQEGHGFAGGNIRPGLKLAALDYTGCTAYYELDMPGSSALCRQGDLEVVQVLGNWPPSLASKFLDARINGTFAPQDCIGFPLVGDSLGCCVVGGSRGTGHVLAIGIHEFGQPFTFASTVTTKNTCHRSPSFR
ncbi:MAG TPA: hypothetical protein VHQ47_13365 [Phycisphaerae bacterium]|nr:hypothetical protein [Phycisphaerae bacterium]